MRFHLMKNSARMPLRRPATARRETRTPGLAAVAALLLLAACAQQPPAARPEPSPPATPAPRTAAPAAPDARTAPPVAAPPPRPDTPVAPTDEPPRPDHSIAFAFDSTGVDERYATVLGSIAEHVRERSDAWIILHAHTDDRGSREYNIALAQRRAEAVQSRLVRLGVAEGRIKVAAYGEERAGADPAAARRVDVFFRYSPR